MPFTSVLRSAAFASIISLVATVVPAFAGAGDDEDSSQSQQNQYWSSGPYDGASFEAAKRAFY
jgi:hypothetical protein